MEITFNYNYIMVALMMILLDIFTGVAAAFIKGDFKSSKMREGGLHKLGLMIVIVFGVSLDYAQVLVDLGFSFPATTVICGYLSLMEILSCIENINKAFPTALPKALTNILYQAANEKGIDTDKDESGE